MQTYLTYYYSIGTEPFRSLSALPDAEAIQIMEALYAEFETSILFERFRDPVGYLKSRRDTEQWVRAAFLAKGGAPQASYPISMVLGESAWIQQRAPDPARHGAIRIPLALFQEGDISFTFPDSMVSRWFGLEKPEPYYLPAYHGQVFTRAEILDIVAERGLPEDAWNVQLPPNLGAYIEAQVWNHALLRQFIGSLREESYAGSATLRDVSYCNVCRSACPE